MSWAGFILLCYTVLRGILGPKVAGYSLDLILRSSKGSLGRCMPTTSDGFLGMLRCRCISDTALEQLQQVAVVGVVVVVVVVVALVVVVVVVVRG